MMGHARYKDLEALKTFPDGKFLARDVGLNASTLIKMEERGLICRAGMGGDQNRRILWRKR